CMDDGSFSEHNKQNQHINSLTNSKFIENIKNVGSKANRLRLAKEAQYEWLLFVDADSKPKSSNYLLNYLNCTKESFEAIFGGFTYDYELEDNTKSLRYTFGKHREEIDANKRNKNPYKVIISANFMIKRSSFLSINNEENINIYGLDYLFSAQLKARHVKINHINNEVYHLGLDSNSKFLEKTRNAVEALHYFNASEKIIAHNISLLRAYNILKSLGLIQIYIWLYRTFEAKMKANLIGTSPNLFVFDTYRLSYLCTL
ncbi:MAG: glycosyltransferase, partial [Flavobacteriaceae bacterium]|nr:glycosyltransferase [Flavobacteriaceae bacterium]